MSKLEKKIKELEARIAQLEARPQGYIPYPVYQPVYQPVYWPTWNPWTITCGSTATGIGGSITYTGGGSNAL